ncbi:isoleucine--tRNA ligase [Exiguobacterium acetylicum]|uniref:isoleucine--tRNA ligase n=1 Tax=Exiguobacterium acetylicum TaxID=41170 RepID=UPI003977BB52
MTSQNQAETVQQREERVRNNWKQDRVFARSIEQRTEAEFVFYEGPPTANGLPHVGHALGRTVKDAVARYKTMQGFRVERKAGWDTHGLPVELGVEKQLGISGKQAIEDYGVEAFIARCKESVFSYETQWRSFTEKLGYWVDMDDPYVTMEDDYIESVWHILGTIHDKGWLTKGHRVSPYCPSCQTSLSSHEVAQGYQDVTDLSATVQLPVVGMEETYLLAWTTTPWTLPANVAVAVHPELTYVTVAFEGKRFIIAKALVAELFSESVEVVSEQLGAELVGLRYEPPFDFVTPENGHTVVGASFVQATSGTGLVHLAPAYGEEDYRVVRENGLSFVNVVDAAGCYTADVPPLAGRFVKESDVAIIQLLAERGRLFTKERYAHSYPHCWRCDSPLLYYAQDNWFIETTAVKEQLLANNASVTWYPDHVKEGRFGKFLEQLVDWNISRNRYWGTPLNVWECEACDTTFVPKNKADLLHRTTTSSESVELHKPYVDALAVSCPTCQGVMHRTPEVIDVWFDSGAMPFAQQHYPSRTQTLNRYPADVVIEGIDQTRGWFYSLQAISTLFTGQSAYKRVLALGHVLDENGQKMSKSRGNALDPVALIDAYGADSLRWALLVDSSPWSAKRFAERIVQEAKSKLVDTLDHAVQFYLTYAELDAFDSSRPQTPTRLDEWLLSRVHQTTQDVTVAMDDYQLTQATRSLAQQANAIHQWLQQLPEQETMNLLETGSVSYQTALGHEVEVSLTDVIVEPIVKTGFAAASESGLTVTLDTRITEALEQERWMRELVRYIQSERKAHDLSRDARIDLVLSVDAAFQPIVETFEPLLFKHLALSSVRTEPLQGAGDIQLGGHDVGVSFVPTKEYC